MHRRCHGGTTGTDNQATSADSSRCEEVALRLSLMSKLKEYVSRVALEHLYAKTPPPALLGEVSVKRVIQKSLQRLLPQQLGPR